MADNIPLSVAPTHIHQPLRFLNPTKISFKHATHTDDRLEQQETPSPPPDIHFVWSSRNNRKGRHAIAITPSDAASDAYDVPPFTDSFAEIRRNIWRMLTYYPVWDISWLGAYIFTIGSVIWVINGFLVFQPWRKEALQSESYWGGGITAFIGATVYEIGSILLMLEAVNANRSGCFGWALEQLISPEGDRTIVRATPSNTLCNHHHINKKSLTRKPEGSTEKRESLTELGHTAAAWTWWPSEDMMKNSLAHDLGFWASSAQMFGATVFWISGFTSLPGVYNHLHGAFLTGAYWVPQIIGGVFFVISGLLFMLETQRRWWRPAFRTLG